MIANRIHHVYDRAKARQGFRRKPQSARARNNFYHPFHHCQSTFICYTNQSQSGNLNNVWAIISILSTLSILALLLIIIDGTCLINPLFSTCFAHNIIPDILVWDPPTNFLRTLSYAYLISSGPQRKRGLPIITPLFPAGS